MSSEIVKKTIYDKRTNNYYYDKDYNCGHMPASAKKKLIQEDLYNKNNICCGFVLPTSGICEICGRVHKIKY